MGQWSHLKFILRELSSIFVGYFVVVIMMLLYTLSEGPESYAQFQECLKTPMMIALNVVSFLFVLFHTITWFNLTPRAMPVRLGGKRLADWMVALPNYIAWIVISGVIAWFVIGG